MTDLLPSIESFSEVTSTNDVARERAAAGAPHGAAVRADVQTGGRGQRGHAWTSPKGGLYLSIVLRPQVPQHVMAGLPVACALGAANALGGLGLEGLRIKWPNDLVVGEMGEKKLGGLLTEAGWSAEGPQPGIFAVCGIGINVETPTVAHPSPHALAPVGLLDALPAGASSPADDELASLDKLARLVRDGVVREVDSWAAGIRAAGPAAMPLTGIMDPYFDLLAYKNEPVALFDREGKPYNAGILTGVDTWGRVQIKIGKREQPFDSAQVSIRPVL